MRHAGALSRRTDRHESLPFGHSIKVRTLFGALSQKGFRASVSGL
jgi:hypothetical protein